MHAAAQGSREGLLLYLMTITIINYEVEKRRDQCSLCEEEEAASSGEWLTAVWLRVEGISREISKLS